MNLQPLASGRLIEPYEFRGMTFQGFYVTISMCARGTPLIL